MFAPRLSLVLFSSLLTTLANSASAQSDSTTRRTCWRGRPQPTCDVFWITELGYYPRIAGIRNGDDPAVGSHGSIDVGRMVNHGRSAHGLLVTVGMGYGSRIGLQARHRRWLGSDGTFDLTGGVVKTKFRPRENSHLEHSAYGITGDVALGWRDYGQLSLRGDLLRSDGRTGSVLYGGVRLGSRPATVVGVTGVALLAVYVAWFAIGMAGADI